MNRPRGFVRAFILIVLVIAIGVAVAWWVDREQTAAIHAGKAGQAATDLLAEPTTGVAPLAVTFSIRRDIGTVQTIDYGNGVSASTADFICGLSYCVRRYIYDQPGHYTASYKDAEGASLRSFDITIQAP